MITMQRARLGNYLLLLGALGVVIALVGWAIGGPLHAYALASNLALAVAFLSLIGYVLLQPKVLIRFFGQRQVGYGLLTTFTVLLFLVLLVVVNLLVTQPPLNQRWDLTEKGDLTLSPQTQDVLRSLPEGVTVLGFYTQRQSSAQKTAGDLLDQYRNLNPDKFSYRFIDPVTEPALASQYQVTRDATLIVQPNSGGKAQDVQSADEQALTTALIKLTRPSQPVVYFLTGHGERRIDDPGDRGMSSMQQNLEADGFKVQALNLLVTDTVPADASVLVIPGPVQPISDTEANRIVDYANGGGSLFLMVPPDSLDPAQDPHPDWGGPLADYLTKTWGLELRRDYVLDFASSLRGAPQVPVVQQYGPSPIGEKLQGLFALFPNSRSVGSKSISGVTVQPVAETSAQASWGETDFASLLGQQASPKPDPGQDAVGPLNLGVSAERPIESASATDTKHARLVVFGSVDFATNAAVKSRGQVNQDVFLNAVNWLAEQENLITIRQKESVERKLIAPTNDVSTLVQVVSMYLLPFAVVLSGLGVWLRRRAQR